MGSATTRAEKRWRRAPTSPPDRPADVELHAWLDEKGGVDWTYVAWPQGPLTEMTHNQRSLVLFDAAWVVADNRAVVGAEAPAVLFALDQQGGLALVRARGDDQWHLVEARALARAVLVAHHTEVGSAGMARGARQGIAPTT